MLMLMLMLLLVLSPRQVMSCCFHSFFCRKTEKYLIFSMNEIITMIKKESETFTNLYNMQHGLVSTDSVALLMHACVCQPCMLFTCIPAPHCFSRNYLHLQLQVAAAPTRYVCMLCCTVAVLLYFLLPCNLHPFFTFHTGHCGVVDVSWNMEKWSASLLVLCKQL